jgi:nitroreductase
MVTGYDREKVQSALVSAAEFAGLAPSIHNTQPWRWRVVGKVLELRAERQRQLEVTDPYGHLLLISCGAALHHAVTALAAEGWRSEIRRIPDRDDPELLATVTVTASVPASTEAMRAVQILRIRHTDRRPVSETPPATHAVEAVAAAAAEAGASLHRLRPDEVIELAVVADRAQEAELGDPEWQAELAYWSGGLRAGGTGIPDSAIPGEPAPTTVPGRDFGRRGTLAMGGDAEVSAGHDGAAVYGILFGQDDSAGGWLRAGEALSAAWVTALEHGLSILPMSAAVEIPATRQSLRHVLGHVAEPYLALRLGIADPNVKGPDATPRLPVEQILDVVA